jgi:O-antigen/teichoic acid export membrane protein
MGSQAALRVVNLVLGVVVTLTLVRTLGDAGFGQWATVFAITEVVGYLSDFGLEQLAVRRAASDPEREPSWVGALTTLRFTLGVPLVLVSLAILLPISVSAEMRATSLLVSATILAASIASARAILQLRVRNDLAMVVTTANSALWAVAVVAIAEGDGGMVAFAAAFLVVQVLTNLLYVLFGTRMGSIRLRGSRELWRPLLRVGIPLGVAGLLTIAYVRIDGVLVFALAGEDEAGLYAAVYRVLDRIQFLPIVVMTTLFPLIAAAWPADRGRVHRLVQAAVDLLTVLALPALAFTVVAAEPVVDLLFGDEFERAAPALPILMGAFIAVSFWQLSLNVIIVVGLERRLVLFAALGLVVNVVLNLIFIPPFGFLAAAWVTVATEALVAVLAMVTILRALGLRLSVNRPLRALAAAVAMGLATFGLNEAGAGLAVLVVAACAVYGVALVAAGAVQIGELRQLVRERA